MVAQMKKQIRILGLGIALTAIFLITEKYIPPANFFNLKLYDVLNQVEYRLRKLPPEIKDIIIVSIDNDTISKMPHRWPYPRSIFASAIKNLTLAQARVIAFDFAFLGKSEEKEDEVMESAFRNNNKIVLASTIDDAGSLNIHSLPSLGVNVPTGIVTKLQDMDGEIRKNLTYLISDEMPPKGFLSWEMAILKSIDGLSITPVKGKERCVFASNDKNEKWAIPVDRRNKSFIINFRAHTKDFRLLSFYDAYKGNFDPKIVKGKIVLVGFVSPLLGDILNTPIGWIPGITLNANSFLTLYTRSFISNAPVGLDKFLTLIGVILSITILLLFDARITAIVIGAEIIIFFIASYALLTTGYIWDYFAFPFSVAVFPGLGKKLYGWMWQRKKFYLT
jgi:CHASE2 domain-containing sensor protein